MIHINLMTESLAGRLRSRRYRERHPQRRERTVKQYNFNHPEGRKEQQKRYHKKHPRSYLKRKYGLTLEQWELLFEAQGRCCAICKSTTPRFNRNWWSTDHDHVTGKFRGILCHKCNCALGNVDDSVYCLQRMVEYLQPSCVEVC
jgi:hypothetical protein